MRFFQMLNIGSVVIVVHDEKTARDLAQIFRHRLLSPAVSAEAQIDVINIVPL